MAERRVGLRRRAEGESSNTPASDQLWRLARQGRRQHLKLDPLSRRHFPLELPKLNLGVPTHTLSFPAPTPSHRGSLPAISKCHSRLNKVTFTLSVNYPLKMKLLFVLIVFSSEAQRGAAASEELLHASCARAPPAGLLTPAHARAPPAGLLTPAHARAPPAGLLTPAHARAPPAGLLTPAHASRAQATLTLHVIQ
ncbi:unnamed protein product [Leuciscus chuanchicus]